LEKLLTMIASGAAAAAVVAGHVKDRIYKLKQPLRLKKLFSELP